MHLTGLANVCVDNPTGSSTAALADGVLSFLQTDTVLFFSQDDDALKERQEKTWLPLIEWFNHFYKVQIKPSRTLSPPNVASEDLKSVKRHLMSHSSPGLHALAFGADALKSAILMVALGERVVSVEEAVSMARLEVQFQVIKRAMKSIMNELSRLD